MGEFGGGGSTTVQQSGPPEPFKTPLMNTGVAWLDPNSRNTAQANSFMSPALFEAIGGAWGQQARGDYLDPSTNPALQRYLAAGQQASQRNLGTSLAGLESQFAKAGQYSMGTNSPLLQAEKQAVQTSQQQLDEANAAQLLGTYGQERGLQNLALGQLDAWNKTPINQAEQIANMFKAGTSTTSQSAPGWGTALLGGLSSL
jgi:hypothetical protein